ncbi:MAG: glycoside hydrolase family 9 protein [Bacteroidales bacterium]|nr:glycoside hydrolase family 9 protein [Bacteroidales bacterium]
MRTINYLITVLIALVVLPTAQAQQKNQHGYAPQSVKRVFMAPEYAGKTFQLLNNKGEEVYSGAISNAKEWPHSGTTVCYADFSELKAGGQYELLIEGSKQNVAVTIDAESYSTLGNALVKSYYMARVSEPVKEQYAGQYARPLGHADDKVIIHESAASKERPAGSVISSPGGWYDAGDYGKYIVNSAITTYSLLHVCEMFPEYTRSINLNIPESGNGASDVLNEAIINLKWMLTMQDPNDGGVYHKLTSKRFCGMVMPHKDPLDRYVVMKSTAATLDFAATMAKASRVIKPFENIYPGLADECLAAAEYAWQWSLDNPAILYQQPKDIQTGQYGDKHIDDEWFWAATELYLATGKKLYYQAVKFDEQKFSVPQWGRVNTLGLYSLLGEPDKVKDLNKKSRKALLRLAEKFNKDYETSAYRISITKFPWGSNSELSNEGMLFIHAYQLTKDIKYLEAADACVGYLLGANPLGYSFVTGFGTKSPMRVHDRRCEADGIEAPIPGLLAGGPSLQAQHDCGKNKYPSSYPAMSYLDEKCSFSTNEIAINWNASASFLVLGLDAIYQSEK